MLERFDLHGRTVVVTGGGRGLGRGMAMALAAAGANVMVAARTEVQLQSVVDEIREAGGVAAYCLYDATSEDDANRLVESCVAEFGRLDALFANAGGGGSRADVEFWEYPTEVARGMIDANYLSVFYACRAAAGQMVKQGEGGVLVPTSSASALRGSRNFAYPTAKGAVISFTKSLAGSLAEHNIRANCIVPGLVVQGPPRDEEQRANQMRRGPFIPVRRPGEWWELGPLAVFLASDASSYITGQNFIIDGGSMAGGLGPSAFRPEYEG